MTTRSALLLAAVALPAFLGCATSGARRVETERTVLEVDNQSFDHMRIYVVQGGSQRIRLGSVEAKSRSSFTIPVTVLGSARELQFLADPLAGNRPSLSHRIWVHPGERVMMTIPP